MTRSVLFQVQVTEMGFLPRVHDVTHGSLAWWSIPREIVESCWPQAKKSGPEVDKGPGGMHHAA